MKIRLIRIAAGVVLFFIAVFISRAVANGIFKGRFQSEVEKVRSFGFPTTPSEMRSMYLDHSRPLRRYDIAEFRINPAVIEIADATGGFDASVARLRSDSSLMKTYLEDVDAILKEEILPADFDFEDGFGVKFVHLQQHLARCQVLAFDATLKLRDEKLDDAVIRCAKIAAIRNAVMKEPFALSFRFSTILDEKFQKSARAILDSEYLTVDAATRVRDASNSDEFKKYYVYSLQGELACGIYEIIRSGDGEGPNGDSKVLNLTRSHSINWIIRPAYWRAAANYVDSFATLIRLAEGGYASIRKRLGEFEAESQVGTQDEHFLASNLIPCVSRSASILAVMIVKNDLIRLSADVKIEMLKAGKMPDSVAGIESTVDPFSGAPYKCAAGERALVIYSVGGDMKDDGGAVYARGKGDIPIRITLSPSK